MSDEKAVLEAIMAQGPEAFLGMDTHRIWATGAQVLANSDFTILVFREQAYLDIERESGDDGGTDRRLVLKNVASVVMPTLVARAFSELLSEQMAQHSGTEGS